MGLCLVVYLLLAGLLAPWLLLDDPTQIRLLDGLIPPTLADLRDTDHLGRATFSRIVHGARSPCCPPAPVRPYWWPSP
ncbi:MAG: hypothetical protein OXR67_17455 [Chloroflexota bacterium]|nr:hypothetical protein [Chloroflexota bacterium]